MATRFSATSQIRTNNIGQVVDDVSTSFKNRRRTFERHWYDNNFFDDGHHYRFLQRSTNKIVDLSERSTVFVPKRAIPKASRQIRGVANLLVSSDPTPVVYPEKVSKAQFPDRQVQDQSTGQPVMEPSPEFKEAVEKSKNVAKSIGHWIEEEFKDLELQEKLAHMVILTAKHGVSFMEVWPDPVKEAIKIKVFDAFDIVLRGELTSIYDSPAIIKEIPMLMSEIMANEDYDEDQKARINADNKFAGSTLKESYLRTRYGGMSTSSDQAATGILKEAFFKEYLDDDNKSVIKKQENGKDILEDREEGDPVIRQVFSVGGVWLKDEYVDLPEYPFVDFRMEPGPIYQVPLIERFIPSNKSLDSVISRLERYTHTMVTGTWMKRRGEQFNISNISGGQIIEYDGVPPVQGQIAPIPQFFFQFINLLNSFIEEQGVTTTTLGKIPAGVESGKAIEALKESEFANLVIASRQITKTVTNLTKRMLDIGDKFFITPQTKSFLDKGEPQYFDIIGATALKKRGEVKLDTPDDVIPIKKDYHVTIQVQNGLGFTKTGQKAAVQTLIETLLQYAQMGVVSPEAIQVLIEKWLETFEFGSTSEFMEAMQNDKVDMTDVELEKIKVAVLEVFKDLQGAGVLPTSEQRVDEGKLSSIEAIKDAGLADKEPEPQGSRETKTKETVEQGKDGTSRKVERETVEKS